MGLEVSAFYSKAGKRKSKLDDKQKKHCTHCNIHGHDVSECRKLKAKKEVKAHSSGKKLKALPAPSSMKITTADSDSDANNTDSPIIYRATFREDAPIAEEPTVYRTAITAAALVTTEHVLVSNDLLGQWIVGSRASRTMCSHRDWFHSFSALLNPSHVILSDDSRIPVMGLGHIHVQFPAEGKWCQAILENVLFILELHGNLLSVIQFTKHGARLMFNHTSCKILSNSDKVLAEGKTLGNLYTISADVIQPPSTHIALLDAFPSEGDDMPDSALSAKASSTTDLVTWHRCLAHLNAASVLQMVRKGMVKGIKI